MAQELFYNSSGSATAPYDTVEKGTGSWPNLLGAIADPDAFVTIFDNSVVLAASIFASSVGYSGNASFKVRSISKDPLLCTIDGNGVSRNIFFDNEATDTFDWEFEGIKFINSAGFTHAAGGAVFRNTGPGGNLTYTNCRLKEIDFTIPSASFSPLIRNDVATSTLTFNNSVISHITSISTGAALADGLVSVAGPLVFNGLTIDYISKDQQANNQASLGIINAKNTITIDGLYINNITMKCPDGSNGNHPAIIYCSSSTHLADVANVFCLDSDASGNTLTKTGGSHVGGLLTFLGPYSANTVVMEKAIVTEDVTNGLGCCITATGSTAIGTTDRIVARYCTAQHGVAIYMSQGASGVHTNYDAHNNTAVGRAGVEPGAGGAVYFGGDGDNTLNYSKLNNNTADEGGAIYAHQQGAPSRAKFSKFQNIVMYGNKATGGDGGQLVDGAFFRGDLTFPHTVDVINTISWNGGTLEMQATADATVVFTVDHSNVEGGAAAVVGEDTYTNNINADPKFRDAAAGDFKLLPGSPCIKAGTELGFTEDFYGGPVGPAIGVNEYDGSGESSATF